MTAADRASMTQPRFRDEDRSLSGDAELRTSKAIVPTQVPPVTACRAIPLSAVHNYLTLVAGNSFGKSAAQPRSFIPRTTPLPPAAGQAVHGRASRFSGQGRRGRGHEVQARKSVV